MRQPLTPKALNQQDKHLPTLPSNRIPTVVTQTPEDGIYIFICIPIKLAPLAYPEMLLSLVFLPLPSSLVFSTC